MKYWDLLIIISTKERLENGQVVARLSSKHLNNLTILTPQTALYFEMYRALQGKQVVS
jgi:hypothetical protein